MFLKGGPDRVSLKFNAGPSRLIPHTWPLSWILKPWAMGGAGGNNTSDSQNIQTAPFLLQCEVSAYLKHVVIFRVFLKIINHRCLDYLYFDLLIDCISILYIWRLCVCRVCVLIRVACCSMWY